MRKVAFCIVFLMFLSFVPSVRSQTQLPLFLLEAKPGCYNTLLTFEKYPEATTFEIWRGDTQESLAQKTITFSNWHLDQDNTNQGRSYYYQIKARSENNNLLSQSNIVFAQNTCPSENSCSVNLEYKAASFMYTVDGRQEGPMDAAPEITLGKMFLVIRYVTKEVEASVAWDAQNKKITITTWDNKTIVLWIGQPDAMVGGLLKRIDTTNAKVTPYIKKGRTYLPMRFVAESLGSHSIEWDAQTSRAIISMKKPKCFDLNSFNITSSTYDVKSGLLNGYDDTGCQLNVILSDVQIQTAKKVANGARIKVFPLEYNKTSDVPEFKSKYLEIVDLKDAKDIKCKFIKATDYSITVTDCEGKEQTYRISMPLLNIRILTQGDTIILSQKERNVLDLRKVLLETVCQDEKIDEIKMKVDKVNCRGGYVVGKIIDKIFNDRQSVLYFKPDSTVCNVKVGFCYIFKCFKDQLGRNVVNTLYSADCPYQIEIAEISRQYKFFPKGSKCTIVFRLENKEKNISTIAPIFEPLDFEVENLEISKSISLSSLSIKDVSVSFKLGENRQGVCSFNYGYSDRGTKKIVQGDFNVFEPDFEVEEGVGNLTDPKDITVKIIYRITNKSKYDLKINCFAYPESDTFPATIKFPITPDRLIPSESTRDITFEIYWKTNAVVETKHKIIYGASCGSMKIMHGLTLEVRKGGPYVRINEPSINDSGLCKVFYDIDWKIYEKKLIEIDWGDGKVQEVQSAPVSHTYTRKGIFVIKITAYAVTGETGTAKTEAIFQNLRPSINIDELIREKDKEDNEYNVFTITGSVEWNTLEKGKIIFDWGDGTLITGNFPQKHKYSKGTKHLTITAVAKTGEEATKILILDSNLFRFRRFHQCAWGSILLFLL